MLAIDLETDLLYDLDEPNVDVISADVLQLDLPRGSLDLIHTRAVLTHIPERARAIDQLVSWLAPGGWLVLEETDWLGQVAANPAWSAGMQAYNQATVTMDWNCGRELVCELAARGLDDIDADAEIDAIRGGTPSPTCTSSGCARAWRCSPRGPPPTRRSTCSSLDSKTQRFAPLALPGSAHGDEVELENAINPTQGGKEGSPEARSKALWHHRRGPLGTPSQRESHRRA